MNVLERKPVSVLRERLEKERRFLQVLAGPRQVGKTTLALQVSERLTMPTHYAAADAVGASPSSWLETEWEKARTLAGRSPKGAVLFLDEVQKIPDWSALVKKLWDEWASLCARAVAWSPYRSRAAGDAMPCPD
jgi:hypothetical protein